MSEQNNAGYFVEIGVLVPAILSAALPSPFTMRTFAHDAESVKTLRLGELVGAGMVLTLGVAESLRFHSPMPMVLVLVVGGAWFLFIEWAIRNPTSKVHDMSDNTSAGTPSGNAVDYVGAFDFLKAAA